MFYSFGYNQYNINKKANGINNDSLHAEMDCLKKLRKQSKKTWVNVLVFRISANNYLNAKPCESCYRSIISLLGKKNYILRNIYYTMDNSLHIL
jgi:deoxycytidylate deaminase